MRKLIFAVVVTAGVILGFTALTTAAASAQALHPSTNCAWAPADPTCQQAPPPGAPGACTPWSFAHGGCVTDTLSLATRSNHHDRNWNRDHNRGPQDPCIIHRPQVREFQAQDRFRNTTDIRGCRCQVVKIWHTKWTWDNSKCRWVESWYFTTKSICRDHHRDPRQCGCHVGVQGQPVPARNIAA